MTVLGATPNAPRGLRTPPSDPLLVPIPIGLPGEMVVYPRTSGNPQGLIPHLNDQSMALPGFSRPKCALWRPQDGHYDLPAPPYQSNLALFFWADDVDANASYNSAYFTTYPEMTGYTSFLLSGTTLYTPAVLKNGWANSPLCGVSSAPTAATGPGNGTSAPAISGSHSGQQANSAWYENAILMPNSVNGHSAVRTTVNNAQVLNMSGSASVLNFVHNTANFEFIAVARCLMDSASADFAPQLLACSSSGSANAGAFGFYNGAWAPYASSTSGHIFNSGDTGLAYAAGQACIYGAYGSGSGNVTSYVNTLSNSTTYAITTGNLGSGNSQNDWSMGYDSTGSRAYPFELLLVCLWNAAFANSLIRQQFLNQINRMYHLF